MRILHILHILHILQYLYYIYYNTYIITILMLYTNAGSAGPPCLEGDAVRQLANTHVYIHRTYVHVYVHIQQLVYTYMYYNTYMCT